MVFLLLIFLTWSNYRYNSLFLCIIVFPVSWWCIIRDKKRSAIFHQPVPQPMFSDFSAIGDTPCCFFVMNSLTGRRSFPGRRHLLAELELPAFFNFLKILQFFENSEVKFHPGKQQHLPVINPP